MWVQTNAGPRGRATEDKGSFIYFSLFKNNNNKNASVTSKQTNPKGRKQVGSSPKQVKAGTLRSGSDHGSDVLLQPHRGNRNNKQNM